MRAETNADKQDTPAGSRADAHMETGRMSKLVRLEDLGNFEMASGDPDPLSDDVDEVVVERSAAAIELLETANLDRAAEISDTVDDHRFFSRRRAGRADVRYLVRKERQY